MGFGGSSAPVLTPEQIRCMLEIAERASLVISSPSGITGQEQPITSWVPLNGAIYLTKPPVTRYSQSLFFR